METPDFAEIARVAVMTFYGTTPQDSAAGSEAVATIAHQLRLVWNARGAADIAQLDTELSAVMGARMAGPYVKNLGRALRTLDR